MLRKNSLDLDTETADRITILNLKDYRKLLKKELSNCRRGKYLHSEDVALNHRLIDALDLIIEQFEA